MYSKYGEGPVAEVRSFLIVNFFTCNNTRWNRFLTGWCFSGRIEGTLMKCFRQIGTGISLLLIIIRTRSCVFWVLKFDLRYAVTVWYMDAEERREHAERMRTDKENKLGSRV